MIVDVWIDSRLGNNSRFVFNSCDEYDDGTLSRVIMTDAYCHAPINILIDINRFIGKTAKRGTASDDLELDILCQAYASE